MGWYLFMILQGVRCFCVSCTMAKAMHPVRQLVVTWSSWDIVVFVTASMHTPLVAALGACKMAMLLLLQPRKNGLGSQLLVCEASAACWPESVPQASANL